MSPELKTPPHRWLIRTDTPGSYRRGSRYVAITYRGGKRIKTTHNTKAEARRARDRRAAFDIWPRRERFEDYAKRWVAESDVDVDVDGRRVELPVAIVNDRDARERVVEQRKASAPHTRCAVRAGLRITRRSR